MAELPVMQLFVERILADTLHFSTEQRGAYAWILFAMWANGARLKNNEDQLMRIAAVRSRKRWREKIWPGIVHKFTIAGDEISQKRMTAVWLMTQEKRKNLTRNARVGRAKYLNSLDRTAAEALLTKTKDRSSSSLEVRAMSAEEFMQLKQRHVPLGPVEWKPRSRR